MDPSWISVSSYEVRDDLSVKMIVDTGDIEMVFVLYAYESDELAHLNEQISNHILPNYNHTVSHLYEFVYEL